MEVKFMKMENEKNEKFVLEVTEELQNVSAPTPPNGLEDTLPNQSKKKKHTKGILLVAALLIILGIAAYLYLKTPVLTPKRVFTKAIEKTYETVKEVYEPILDDEVNDSLFKEKGLSLDLKSKINLKMDGQESAYGLNAKFEADKTLEKGSITLGLEDSSKEVLSLTAYQKEKTTYLKSPKLFDYIIDLGTSDDAEIDVDFDELANNDSFALLTLLKDYLIDNMDENDFKSSTGELEANGEKLTVTKYTYVITKNVAKKLGTGFSEYTQKQVNDGKADLSDETLVTIESLKDFDYEDFETMEFNIYSIGYDFYGFDIVQDDDKLFSYYELKNKIEGNILIDPEDNAKEENFIFKGEIKDNKIYLDVFNENANHNKVCSLVIEANDSKKGEGKIKIDYSFEVEGEVLTGVLELSNKTSSKKDDVNSTMKIVWSIKGNDTEVEIVLDVNVKTIEDVTLPDLNDAKAIDDLSEDDMFDILNNLQNSLEGTDFESLLSLILGQSIDS